MPDDFIRALLTITFGALAGGLTNTVAIWMLFHPYEPPTLFSRRVKFLQGAIPKNQPRLAAAIGRTVGNRLLTEEDLTQTFAEPEFRKAFNEGLSGFLDSLLNEERGSLSEIMPTQLSAEIDGILDEVVDKGVDRLMEYLRSDMFETSVRERAEDVIRSVADEPIGGLLTPAREEALTDTVEEWLSSAVENAGFERAVDGYLSQASENLLRPDRTFEEVLPSGLVGSVEKAIQSYLPLAIERLGTLLEDPEARTRFQSTIHDLFHRFLNDLKLHQRVVARLIVTENTVDKVLDAVEDEGVERISEMLQEPPIREAMSRGINEAILEFLRRPIQSVIGGPDDDEVVQARETITHWIVGMAREPSSRAFIVEKLQSAVEKTSARTWGDLLKRVPPDRLAEWISALASSEAADGVYRDAGRRLVKNILERPIGTPGGWLPVGAQDRIEQALGDPVWNWLQTQVPDVVQRLDVARRVEDKVLHFPVQKMEELVRKVTDRELRQIVKLGYLLGAVIGLALVGIDLVLR